MNKGVKRTMIRTLDNTERADYDILIDSFFKDINLSTITKFPIITIYKNSTKDYQGKYVARLYDIRPGEVRYTRYIMLAEEISDIYKGIPTYMNRVAPQSTDDPVVLESWL